VIKKILLINPPNTMPKDSVRRIGEPLGLLYLGACLKAKGYEAAVFDMACEGYNNIVEDDTYVTYGSSFKDLKDRMEKERADAVGISCMFTAREKNTKELCGQIRKIDKSVPIILGGLHPSLFPEDFIENGFADYVVMSEGEERLVKLIDCLNAGKPPDFDGIAYRDSGALKVRPVEGKIKDLDSVPFPARDLVDMESYIKIGAPYAPFSYKKRVAQILATRGCPNKCNFCSTVSYWGRVLRFRSVDNIIGEMRILKDKYGIEEIQFVDDNMTANKKFARELFTRMKEFDFKWCTPHGLMFNSLDAELIKLMADSGAYQLTFAIESASPRVLKEIIHKDVNLGAVRGIVTEAHKYDISVHGMFVMGFPGEKKEEIMQSLEFPFHAGFDSVSFFVVNPLPGSELYGFCKEKNYINEDYSAMDFKTANINIPSDSADYNMDPTELVKMVDEKTYEFNEWAKKEYPDRWKRKFERYLALHPEEKEKIMGRVT